MVKKFYEAPELELIQLTVEAGFAVSSGSSGSAETETNNPWGN